MIDRVAWSLEVRSCSTSHSVVAPITTSGTYHGMESFLLCFSPPSSPRFPLASLSPRLASPHIASSRLAPTQGPSPCMVYPLLSGGTLQDRLIDTTEGQHRLELLGHDGAMPRLSWKV